jgi:arylsulfatase A-like enzyme
VAGPPNILWITTDHQRTDALGCYGSTWAHSPNIDALARRGVRCAQATCQSPSCTPSRASMWTGNYVQRLGTAAYGKAPEPTAHTPLVSRFREAGYETAHLGKYNYMNNPAALEACFDLIDYGLPPGGSLTPWCVLPDGIDVDDDQFIRAPYNRLVVGGVNPLPEDQTYCAVLTRMATDYLRQPRNRPFFLRWSLDVPHMPFVPIPRFHGITDRDRVDLSVPTRAELESKPKREIEHIRKFYNFHALTPGQLREARGCFYDLCAELDEAIGRLLQVLAETGADENTIIVINTDHGAMLGEHGVGTIRTFYDPVIQVPLIWSWPGRLPEDTVMADPVELIDLLPTLLDLAGLDLPATVDGRSISSQLLGKASAPDRPTFSEYDTALSPIGGSADWVPPEAYWHPAVDRRIMIRADGWKLDRNYGASDYGPDGALYDLRTDPAELVNLFDHPHHRPRREQLERLTSNWLDQVQV